MKKIAVSLILILAVAGFSFAKSFEDSNGALGFGIVSEAGDGLKIDQEHIKWGGFLDIGWQLAGPIYVGVEFQAAIKKTGDLSYTTSTTFIDSFLLDTNGVDSTYITYIHNQTLNYSYTFFDSDFSPRGFVSIDLSPIQLLAFAGLSKNFQTYDYKVTNAGASSVYKSDNVTLVGPGGTVEQKSGTLKSSPWGVVAGLRASVSYFYLDYTRFLDMSGTISVSKYTTDKISIGASLRW